MLTPEGELELSIPRDRLSSFDPQLVAKHQRRLPNFDNNIISLYAKGMGVREIQRHLLELYGLEISPDLISTITDEVLSEVEQWQKRGLEAIYQATDADAAQSALHAFADSEWGKKFPTVADMWKRQWEQVIPFFAYPQQVRKIIYTTNAIESLHMQLRKVTKNRGHFPNDMAATKLLYLALRDIEKKWKMPPVTWKQAANQFAIMFGGAFHVCAWLIGAAFLTNTQNS